MHHQVHICFEKLLNIPVTTLPEKLYGEAHVLALLASQNLNHLTAVGRESQPIQKTLWQRNFVKSQHVLGKIQALQIGQQIQALLNVSLVTGMVQLHSERVGGTSFFEGGMRQR